MNKETLNSKKYFLKEIDDFDASTIINPNKYEKKDEAEFESITADITKEKIEKFCSEQSISINTLCLTCTLLTLNKFNFSDKNLIFTKNNIPLSFNFENRHISIEKCLKYVDKKYDDCLKYSKSSFNELLDEYNFKIGFYFAFNSNLKQSNNDCSNYLNITESEEKITLSLTYNELSYTSDYIKLFLKSIEKIINQIITRNINELEICDIAIKKETENIIFSDIENPFLHKHFENQVMKTPDKIALITNDEHLTYDELNQKANRIANGLIKKGVKSKNNILILLGRNSNLIASILGVLKAGCAFIPMDITYPQERINYISKDSESEYIISDTNNEKHFNIEDLLKEENTDNPNIEISSQDLAYMIYTSGSTGNPKGVMISHENITNLLSKKGNNILYSIYSKINKAISISTISFDAFIIDFISLAFGSTLILANDNEIKNIVDLISLIKKEKPDSFTSVTPSRLEQYLEFEEFRNEFANIKSIFIGGEPPQKELINDLLENYNVQIYNGYGPTETTITCNFKIITNSDDITIGTALHNYVINVRDIDGKLLPQGIVGELYIGGKGVGKGYYNLNEKTEESYLQINNVAYYKSGDYAIENPNGEIEIKGRIDNQIKLRGLRIEIGEIETNINSYPSIEKSIVLIKKINNIEHLCAYYTAKKHINKEELKEYLKTKLTQYMVPTIFIQVNEMPQTPNGKTDTKQLPEPKIELNYIAPENKLEQTLCSIFSATLNLETVGAEDNFFEIGGTSLIASKLIIELMKRGYDISYKDIFTHQTPRKLAKFLKGELKSEDLDTYMIKKYDYSKINELLKENTLKNFYNGKKTGLGNVLLTGVTGYLGIHVLYEYIENEKETIYCMLRKGEFDTPEERLNELMKHYFKKDLSKLIGSRIILSEGDITRLNDFKKLEKYPIDTIINCAAIVKHYTADDYIFKVNVDGVINGIKFARLNNIKYVQISTVSVLSPPKDENADVKFDEQTLYYNQDLSNKYVNSKFLAEKIILGESLEGLNAKIIRVGNLMARYDDGQFQRNYESNAFLGSIKALKKIQAISETLYEEILEMSPIDYVAKSILALSKTPKECRVFNCLNENMIYTKNLIDALNSFDFNIKKVNDEEFINIIKENMDENIQGLITSELSITELKNASKWREYGKYINIDQTSEILHASGINWPKINENYLKKFINHLNNENFFD